MAGRQGVYFRYFLDPQYFSDADVARYAASYAAPEHLHAAFQVYRAFAANEKFNAEHQSRFDVPLVLAVGGESPFLNDLPTMAEALRAHGCTNVTTGVIEGSSHYVADEQPALVEEFIEKYASPRDEGEKAMNPNVRQDPRSGK